MDECPEDYVRRQLVNLINQTWRRMLRNDLTVKRVLTLDGYPLFLLVALNGTEQALSALTKQIGGRRQISVGPIGVFVVRPDDVGKLISSIAA